MMANYLEWFEATQGLRQGCVLSPLLLSVFLAASLHVELVHLSQYEAIVHTGSGPPQ